ncbi:MAG: DUF441 domain-containing protein [Clostridia bacterium]|nr:DUF441 domain-containing protein [Clostridia bacterium]
MESTLIILAVLVAAVLGRANSVALAAGGLLLLKLAAADRYVFPALARSGLFWGLAVLTAAILVPLANGDVTARDLWRVFTSWVGVLAFVFSLLTTYLSGQGLQYLTAEGHGEVMPALVLGAVVAAAFLGGVPVGPLITSGLLALTMKLIGRF